MGYSNNLTASVEAYIKKSLVEKIAKANEALALCDTAQEIREYLCDNSTVNTSDFVLRRYIYTYHKELFSEIDNYEELAQEYYHKWSEDVVNQVAKSLSSISKKRHGLNISTKTWNDYLTGSGVKQRKRVFQMAFVLQMDVESTLELLLAYDMEPYSVRNPIELVCIFCQKNPYKYTWYDVENILESFESSIKEEKTKGENLTEGMTQIIESELDKIFNSNLPDEDTKQLLVKYMIDNSNEFKSFIKKDKRVYLSGYSVTRMNKFFELMKYLVVLYPTFSEIVETEDELKVWIYEVRNSSDGYPKLQDLKKAMFQTQDWNFEEWDIPEEKTGTKDFQENIYYSFCNTYANHLWAVERLREGGNSVEFFERRDALLFAYFLINGYLRVINENDVDKNKKIENLLQNKGRFENQLNMIFEALEMMDVDNPLEKYDTTWQCINFILKELDYPTLYVPSAFDRFIVLSLMSVSPDELTPLIMNQANLDNMISEY